MLSPFFSDSVVYIWRLGEYEIPTGCFLGDWTDEITKDYGPGALMIDFVSTGSKSYSYQVKKANGEICTVLKSKGWSLNWATGRSITFDTMVSMVDEYIQGVTKSIIVENRRIGREKDHTVVTKRVPKVFRPTFTKRRLIGYFSEEYGF